MSYILFVILLVLIWIGMAIDHSGRIIACEIRQVWELQRMKAKEKEKMGVKP